LTKFKNQNITCSPLSFRGREPDDDGRRQLSKCHGVILLFGDKQRSVLGRQAESVEEHLLTASAATEEAIASFMPPQEPDSVDRPWFTIPFREDGGRLEEVSLPQDAPPVAGQRLSRLIDLISRRASAQGPAARGTAR
jgi:hypothetical protein